MTTVILTKAYACFDQSFDRPTQVGTYLKITYKYCEQVSRYLSSKFVYRKYPRPSDGESNVSQLFATDKFIDVRYLRIICILWSCSVIGLGGPDTKLIRLCCVHARVA